VGQIASCRNPHLIAPGAAADAAELSIVRVFETANWLK
jgi:hypothetical protein